MAHNLRTRTPKTVNPSDVAAERTHAMPADELTDLEERLGPEIVAQMVNDKGQVDLRRLTGQQAMHYLQTMGIQIGWGRT